MTFDLISKYFAPIPCSKCLASLHLNCLLTVGTRSVRTMKVSEDDGCDHAKHVLLNLALDHSDQTTHCAPSTTTCLVFSTLDLITDYPPLLAPRSNHLTTTCRAQDLHVRPPLSPQPPTAHRRQRRLHLDSDLPWSTLVTHKTPAPKVAVSSHPSSALLTTRSDTSPTTPSILCQLDKTTLQALIPP
jgi:hypothetical protein